MNQQEAHIAGVGTATPFPLSTERFLEIDAKMRRTHGQPEEIIGQFQSLVKGTGIHTRHFVHPHWQNGEETVATTKQPAMLPPGVLARDIFTPNRFIPPDPVHSLKK